MPSARPAPLRPPRPTTRRLAAAASGALALGLLAGVAAPTATARPVETAPPAVTAASAYVALGDSYSAGAGIDPTQAGSPPECLRSSRNYASVVAAQLGLDLTDVTCSGAATTDFTGQQYPSTPPQLAALTTRTRLVTLTIGGNDSGLFNDFVSTCTAAAASTAGRGNPCQKANGNRFARTITTTTAPALVAALTRVRQQAPNARVLVLGYPQILPAAVGCYPAMPFAAGDVPYVRGIETRLNAAVATAAATTGVTFVDLAGASEGEDACAAASTRWIEPVLGGTNPIVIHPNARGERGMARKVLAALGAG